MQLTRGERPADDRSSRLAGLAYNQREQADTDDGVTTTR